MLELKKRYVVDEQNRRVAVQIDLETFSKIEELLENHALTQWMTDTEEDEALDLEAAKAYYDSLEKAR
ncbi:MAG TPA: hypothetical protein VF756_27460 [Thermoanaerobaculia bacterium]